MMKTLHTYRIDFLPGDVKYGTFLNYLYKTKV